MAKANPSQRAARSLVCVLLVALGSAHFFFGVANFGFVEGLPDDLDVLIEGMTACAAAISLFWGATNQIRRKPWALKVLLGGVTFAAGMTLSVVTGASTPDMLQVVLPVLLTGTVAYVLEKRSRA